MSTQFSNRLVYLFSGMGLVIVLAAPMLLGCSDAATAEDTGRPGAGGDADVDAGAASDGGPAYDAGMPAPQPPPADLWLSSGRGQEFTADAFNGDATTCFDGIDNDAAEDDAIGGADCADPNCQELPTCCVNDASCTAPASVVFDSDFGACDDAFCGGDFTLFGGDQEVPVFDSGTLALMGDTFFDTGWFGNEELDLRSDRIDFEVTFSLVGCDDCLETAAVGLSAQAPPGATSVIMPLVALRGIASQQEVQLIIHDRVVASYPAGDQSMAWRLSVRPDGEVEMRHGDVVEFKQYLPSAEAAHLVLYGHSVNPGQIIGGARLDSVKVERLETDRVDAWGPARSLEHAGGRVSAARLDGEDYLAVSDGPLVQFYMASDNTLLNWVFAEDWDAHDYALAQLDGVLTVFAVNADGQLVQGAVDADLRAIAGPTLVFDPASIGWDDFRHPTMAYSNNYTIVVAEVGGALEAAIDIDGTWTRIGGSLRDRSVGAEYPSLVIHGNVYWLHYSVRTGTRERVHALVSDQMFHWRDLGDALAGSGVRDSVDRFSAASPALVADGDVLRMYFTADDHIQRRLAVTERRSPVGRTR